MPIPAEQLEEKTDQSTDQEDTSVGEVFALGSSLEERVSRLEKLMLRHNHMKPDGTTRINGVWRRLKEIRIPTATNSIRFEIPEGYRMYRLYFLGGLSTAASLAFRFNDASDSLYAYNITIFQGSAINSGTSMTNTTTSGVFASFAYGAYGGSANTNWAECVIYDMPTRINSYRGWTSVFHSQDIIDGANTRTGIASGTYRDTNTKLKSITVLTSTGNINENSYLILEGLMK